MILLKLGWDIAEYGQIAFVNLNGSIYSDLLHMLLVDHIQNDEMLRGGINIGALNS